MDKAFYLSFLFCSIPFFMRRTANSTELNSTPFSSVLCPLFAKCVSVRQSVARHLVRLFPVSICALPLPLPLSLSLPNGNGTVGTSPSARFLFQFQFHIQFYYPFHWHKLEVPLCRWLHVINFCYALSTCRQKGVSVVGS